MHPCAHQLGKLVFETYWRERFGKILDIGSLDINGSLREFCPEGAAYTGIDMQNGRGVDLVLSDPYSYPFPDDWFDMVVSTSCFEHDPMFWLTFLEAGRVLSPGGILYINAPSSGSYHTHPWDNWRFYPDASNALELWAVRSGSTLRVVESFCMSGHDHWNDYVMIFRKGPTDVTQPLLSDRVARVRNIRQARSPGMVLNKDHNTSDMNEIAALRRDVGVLRDQLRMKV